MIFGREKTGAASRAFGWVEVVVITAAAPVLGSLADPSDPYLLHSPFPWLLLAPLAVALQHGLWGGLVSSALLSGAAAFQTMSDGALPAEFASWSIGCALVALIAGQIRDTVRGRAQQLAERADSLQDRLERSERTRHLIQLSHAKLEERVTASRSSLAGALEDAERRMAAAQSMQELGQVVLDVLATQGHLHSASLYIAARAHGILVSEPVASFGGTGESSARHPLVGRAFDSGKLAAVVEAVEAARNDTSVLAAIPLITSRRRTVGVVAVHHMPFMVFHADHLNQVFMLAGQLTDMLFDRWSALREDPTGSTQIRTTSSTDTTDSSSDSLSTEITETRPATFARPNQREIARVESDAAEVANVYEVVDRSAEPEGTVVSESRETSVVVARVLTVKRGISTPRDTEDSGIVRVAERRFVEPALEPERSTTGTTQPAFHAVRPVPVTVTEQTEPAAPALVRARSAFAAAQSAFTVAQPTAADTTEQPAEVQTAATERAQPARASEIRALRPERPAHATTQPAFRAVSPSDIHVVTSQPSAASDEIELTVDMIEIDVSIETAPVETTPSATETASVEPSRPTITERPAVTFSAVGFSDLRSALAARRREVEQKAAERRTASPADAKLATEQLIESERAAKQQRAAAWQTTAGAASRQAAFEAAAFGRTSSVPAARESGATSQPRAASVRPNKTSRVPAPPAPAGFAAVEVVKQKPVSDERSPRPVVRTKTKRAAHRSSSSV
jgi:hypothetical protein